MAKTPKNPDLDVKLNEKIPDGKRAEDGRQDVSVGPQRKHDTPAYHDSRRALLFDQSVAIDPNLDLVEGPGETPIEGSETDPNNPNNKSGAKKS